MLWAFADGFPLWNGILWDTPHQSAQDGTLPVSAQTVDSLFSRRLIDENVSATNVDVFQVFRGLLTFALSQPNGGVANLQVPAVSSGIVGSVIYDGADCTDIVSAWNELIAVCGFEYSFRPAIADSGAYVTVLDLGYPQLGLTADESSFVFQMPGNLLDYSYPQTGSGGANWVIASAQNSSGTNFYSQYPHGVDVADLASGAPLLQISTAYTGTVAPTQAQLNAFADNFLQSVAGTQLLPSLNIGAGMHPTIAEVPLGSWCTLIATSDLHPANDDGSPGLILSARVTGWTITPPTQGQAEQIAVQLWVPESIQGA